MREDNKNLLLAIVLSGAVLIGWNYFYGAPLLERQKQVQQTQAQPPAATGQPARVSATPSAVPTAPAPTMPMIGCSPAAERRCGCAWSWAWSSSP
jgi:YidC/Oxa1 family membrane protein insertase